PIYAGRFARHGGARRPHPAVHGGAGGERRQHPRVRGTLSPAGLDSGPGSGVQNGPMKIGTLARRAGVAIDPVRYYEREGLLPAPARLPSGHRDSGDGAVVCLRFSRRAMALAFAVGEIPELLQLSSRREGDRAGVKAAAIHKLADVDATLAELQRIRQGLTELVESCPGHG